jgi:adenosine deaminase
VPLELCPTSNVHSGAVASIAEHPIGLMTALGFRATVNTDNRLMSATTESNELALTAQAFDWDLDQVEAVVVTAAESAFLPEDDRRRLIDGIIRPGFELARRDG